MAKKKSKQRSISILQEVDKTLNSNYDCLMDEIEAMQIQLNIADQKACRKAKKLKRKGKCNDYDIAKQRAEARKEVIREMEGSNLLERIEQTFRSVAPIIICVARLVASFIVSILNVDLVKFRVKPETVKRLDGIYRAAMSIA